MGSTIASLAGLTRNIAFLLLLLVGAAAMTCGPLAKWQQSFGSGEQHEVSFGLGGGGKAHLLTQQDVAGRGEVGEDGRYCNGGGRRGHRLVQTCIFS